MIRHLDPRDLFDDSAPRTLRDLAPPPPGARPRGPAPPAPSLDMLSADDGDVAHVAMTRAVEGLKRHASSDPNVGRGRPLGPADATAREVGFVDATDTADMDAAADDDLHVAQRVFAFHLLARA